MSRAASTSPHPSVLLVQASAETREVLRTVLELRGLRIFEAAAASEGVSLARLHHPNIIVLDDEIAMTDENDSPLNFNAESARDAAFIILGKARRSHLPPGQVVAKPYHFAPLVHTIEQLAAAKAA